MAATTEFVKEVRFSGVTSLKDGLYDAEAFLRNVENRRTKDNWTKQKALAYLVGALSGEAADFYHKTLKSFWIGTYSANKGDYDLVVEAFKTQYNVGLAQRPADKVDLGAQTKHENASAFIDRVGASLAAYEYVDTLESQAVLPAAPAALAAKCDTDALKDMLRDYAKQCCDVGTAERHRMLITEVAKNVICTGLAHADLRKLAWEKADTPTLYEYARFIKDDERRMEKQKTTSNSNFVAKAKKVHAVQEVGASDEEDDCEVAKINFKKPSSKDKRKENKDKGKTCDYCKKKNHIAKDCRKRIRDMADGAPVLATTDAKVTATIYNPDTWQYSGNADGVWC